MSRCRPWRSVTSGWGRGLCCPVVTPPPTNRLARVRGAAPPMTRWWHGGEEMPRTQSGCGGCSPNGHDVRVGLRCERAPPAPLTPPRATSLCHLGTRNGDLAAVSMGGSCGLHKLYQWVADAAFTSCHPMRCATNLLRTACAHFLGDFSSCLSDLRAACPLHTSVAPLHAGVNSLARRCNPLHARVTFLHIDVAPLHAGVNPVSPLACQCKPPCTPV